MRDVTNRLYIFSVFQSRVHGLTNEINHVEELEYLKRDFNLPVINISGCFEGQKELSICVIGDNNVEKIIQDRSELFHQKCYLVVYHDNVVESVTLTLNTITRMIIGKFVEISEEEIQRKNLDFSLINGKYYTIR